MSHRINIRGVPNLIAMAAVVILSQYALADSYVWQGGDGSFNNGSLWKASDNSTGVVPGANDAAFYNTGATNYTITLPGSYSNAYAIAHGTTGNVYFGTGTNSYTVADFRVGDYAGVNGVGVDNTTALFYSSATPLHNNLLSNFLSVGNVGKGTFWLYSGARAMVTPSQQLGYGYVNIGATQGSTGTFNVADAGSVLDTQSNNVTVYVGNAGTGTFWDFNGGVANMGNMYLGNQSTGSGTLYVYDSTTLLNSNNSSLYVGYSGTGSMTVYNGAHVGGLRLLSIGDQVGNNNNNQLMVQSSGSTLDAASLIVGNSGKGSMSIISSGSVFAGSLAIGQNAGSNGQATLTTGGQLITNVLSVGTGFDPFAFPEVNVGPNGGTGSLSVGSGCLVSTAIQAYLGNNGTIDLTGGGAMRIGGDTPPQTPGFLYLTHGGTLGGTGTVKGNVGNLSGVVAPGFSGGTLNITGNFGQTPAGSLNIELGGLQSGSFDKLVVSGTATLDGTMNVSLIGGFKPVAGNSFDVMDWGSESGTFTAGVNLPTLGGRIVWDLSHLYDSGAQGGTLAVTATYYAGDFNRDSHVNAADIALAMVALTDTANYQTGHGLADATLFGKVADVNGDGSFNNADLQYLLTTLKSGGGSADSVPEPASWFLAFMALAMVSGTRFSVRCIG